jgi:ribosomal protein L7/L12
MKGTFSYRNQNPFDIFLPVGQLNSFSPGKTDRGQPSQFFAGLNKAAFSAMVESGVTWSLPGTSSTLSEKTPQCACTTTSNETSKVEILTLSKELLELAYKAADTLDRASRQSMNKLDKEERNRLKDLLNRSGKRMIDTFAEIEVTLSTQIPKSSTACAELQADCRIVDDGPAIDSIRQRYDLIVSMINRLTTRAGFIEENDTRRYREMRKKAANIAEQAVTVLTQVPRFREVCGESSATVKMKVVPKPILRQKDKRASTK